MATTAEHLREQHDERGEERQEDLLRRYLRALAREGGTNDVELGRGLDLRTCPHCGERTAASLEPGGTWFVCGACGRYA